MTTSSASDIEKFKIWLRAHGARFDKIDWPSSATESGIRGGVALEDIETNEAMITIPSKLMMTPESAFSDPDVGEIFAANTDILAGDLLLTQYLVHEISKGEGSFYYPFIRILPDPGSISKWNGHELDELQDERLKLRAEKKRSQLQIVYNSLMSALNARHPDFFSPDVFSLRRFCFAFDTIQARAFGRRLPWTALVPFADCLNHNNVQTKYSYNEEEKIFRLFPTGSNFYDKGSEVYNSYGRRPNYNLLLDYGFCMMDNEWDEVVLSTTLSSDDPLFNKKARILRLYGEFRTKRIHVMKNYIPAHVISFFRVSESHLDDLDMLENIKKTEDKIDTPLNLVNERAALRRFAAVLTSHLTKALPTSEEEDSVQLSFLRDEMLPASCDDDGEGAVGDDSAGDSKWRLLCSLTYRITRKRILKNTILLLEVLGDWIDDIIASRAEGSILAKTPAKPVEMYDSISQFYALPSLYDECSQCSPENANQRPPYDTSANRAEAFVTLKYLERLFALSTDTMDEEVNQERKKL